MRRASSSGVCTRDGTAGGEGVDGGSEEGSISGTGGVEIVSVFFSGTDRGVSTSFFVSIDGHVPRSAEGILGGGVVASESSIVAIESRVFGNWISADDDTLGVQAEWSVVLAGASGGVPLFSQRMVARESDMRELSAFAGANTGADADD